ncbi:ZIP family metal transporter [Lutibacter sp. TH_r2]|uniref:ZIP family metal transporter n=1 Tax=Lutibacter sp. TH_r2 TaxID=3082083 RepID=UPI0029536EA1|nr:ZIP family metal transporter [Lutibacter sp. TH_r2]MDV7187494.1 ZIP family metal transporter [Lutibacter sp. TH_r2]
MTYLILILSVLIGIAIVYGLKPSNKIAQLLLGFSGAYLLSITILHLIPEVYTANNDSVGLFILLGLLMQLILDFFSKGAEHGHIHIETENVFPWALFLSLCAHAFMEGLPLTNHSHHEHLLWAIVIHKVPVAIILGTFFVNSKFPKKMSILFLVLFSLMSPLGTFAGEKIPFLINYKTEISAIIIGIFLHISTVILFESSKEHKFNLLKFLAILVGMFIAYLA